MFWFRHTKRIYLDYAAATPISAEARAAEHAAERLIGNPNALHAEGLAAREALERARTDIARVLQCRSAEIIFTGGGTEGNNLAIFGSITEPHDAHIVVSAIEHPSVLEPIAALEGWGAKVTRVAPNAHGEIKPEAVRGALMPQTKLVSVGWANSEIGVVQPLAAIAKVVREHEAKHGTAVIFHTDAGQAPLYIKSVAHSIGVDVMTLDAGKLYGPRGIGALFVKRGTKLRPTMFGGGQERGMRPGTPNVALAAGFAASLSATAFARDTEATRLAALKKSLVAQLKATLSGLVLNGEDAKQSLPHIANISIPRIDAEYLALALDHRGVALSTKTSCKEGERASAVIAAIAPLEEQWRASSSLRISLGAETAGRDINRSVQIIADTVQMCYKLPQQ